MPRIDPLQLLKCLSVLLSPDGGILSRDEVPRLVNLMTKFSKKLVSKCVYVLILKNTETSLVDMFMAEGGWTLIQTWLQDAAQSGNWDLVKEILGLLLITPVDVERLKMNCLPKLIKNLSRREDLDGVAGLSNQIVQNWLVIVKGSAHTIVNTATPGQVQEKVDTDAATESEGKTSVKETVDGVKMGSQEPSNDAETDQTIKTSTFYKVSVKDGKQIIRKLSLDSDCSDKQTKTADEAKVDDENVDKDRDKSKTSSSSRSGKSNSSSSRDRDKDKRRSSSHSSSSSSKSKSSSSSKDKDRRDKDKDQHRHNGSSRSGKSSGNSSSSSNSSNSSKDKKDSRDKSKSREESKDKQAEKDKDTLEKVKPASLDKVGRIPKKDNKAKDEKDVKKKPTFSILNRKATGEERSKTVKVFNSKMRSTGLEEEVKPPPPRGSKKPTPLIQLPTIPPKRPSPPRDNVGVPPEKKLKVDKIDVPERPGSIKLIPPKPKPPVLQESDMFMDALNASAPKKEAKKRKRRPSVTKETPVSPTSASNGPEAQTPTSPTPASPTSTIGLKNIAPINFYQDTLSESTDNAEEKEETKNDSENNDQESNDTPASPATPTDEAESEETVVPTKVSRTDGIKGVLLYAKKKGPKRSIKWKSEDELVEVRYFELDETERVNVTKTFMDMAKMELSSEREALIMSRKLSNEDVMEPQIMWRLPFLCDQPESLAVPGSKSLEKDIQFAREKTSLPALYFDKRRIPDSPEEPVPENHQMSDPVIIPLDDPDSQEIDLRSTPWPEPKGPAPQAEPPPMPAMFPTMPFTPNFNQMGSMPPVGQFPGVPPPRFPGPVGPHGPMGPAPGPGNFVPPNMMHNNMVPPISQPDMINQGPMNPGMFGPGPDGFMGQGGEPNFHMQQPFNGPQGPNMNMYGPNNFNSHRGRGGGFRRGGNNGGWVRMNGPGPNWKRGGGGNRGGRLCKNIQNHGYCRNGDNCPFIHPS